MKVIFSLVFSLVLLSASSAQKTVEEIGHYTQIGLPLTALGISLVKGDFKGTGQFVKSFVLETAVVISMKRIINRTRPNGKPYSFPSGHTAVSFTSSTFLWKRYGWKYGVPATALAAFVGYSRYGPDEPVHYFSDVVAGCLIGIGSSWIFTSKYEKKVNVDVTGDLSHVGLRLKVNLN